MIDKQTFGILVFGSIGIATVAMVVGNPIALPLALFARVVCEVPYD